MLMKKSFTILVLVLMLTLVLTACGGKAETTTSSTTKTTTTTTTTSTTIPTTTISTTTTTTILPTTTTTTTTSPTTSVFSGPPEVSTGGVIGITLTRAEFAGSIDAGQGIDRQGFDWGTSSGSYAFSWDEQGSFGLGAFSHLVTDFTSGTTYYYRGKAHNSKGWGYGQEKTFRTLGIPKVTGVSVVYALQGTALEISITGIDFTDATAVSFGNGITINSFRVNSDTQIVANITIAADAVTGARTITVTTDIGTGTLPDSFTVKKLAQVKHVFNWTDAQFSQIMHSIAPNPAYTYTLGFHENSQLTLTTTRPYTLWVELRGGKFCITNVDQAFWNDLWASGGQYMSYDAAAKVITLNNLPDALLQTMFDVPLTVMPEFISCNGVGGFVILDYYIEEEIV